jgi:hypothetical protein
MSELDELDRDVCDFCECGRDEEMDDEFVELYVGSLSPPRDTQLKAIVHKRKNVNKENRRYESLLKAIDQTKCIEYDFHDQVREVKQIGGETHTAKMGDGGQYYDSEIRNDKIAVQLTVSHPEPSNEPDAMVCQNCAEMFRSLDE